MPSDEENEDLNPYAPPAATPAFGPERRRSSRNEFADERRSVLALIGLTLITCGLYAPFWYLRRREFLDGLDSSQKLGTGLPGAIIAGTVLSWIVGFVVAANGPTDSAGVAISRAISLAVAIVSIMTAFRVAGILRDQFASTGREIRIAGIWTFLFSIYYLQYKMNEAADLAPERPRRKKKRKKKKRAEEPADALPSEGATARAEEEAADPESPRAALAKESR